MFGGKKNLSCLKELIVTECLKWPESSVKLYFIWQNQLVSCVLYQVHFNVDVSRLAPRLSRSYLSTSCFIQEPSSESQAELTLRRAAPLHSKITFLSIFVTLPSCRLHLRCILSPTCPIACPVPLVFLWATVRQVFSPDIRWCSSADSPPLSL